MRIKPAALLLIATTAICTGQTTQGLIEGTIRDQTSGDPLSNAEITVYGQNGDFSRTVNSDISGFFVVSLLSPGTYRIRVRRSDYQTLEWNGLQLGVAAKLTIPVLLRRIGDVWEKDQPKSVFLPGNSVLQLYGPDVEPGIVANFDPQTARRGALESTVSAVVEDTELREIPLQNRDAYALLVMLPGVTSDLPAARGLGVSVNGQRPTASNYMLDGLDNSNHLLTGPLGTLAPESIQEYRISTNNYSAEYGGASGFIANVASIPGGAQWHGMAYTFAGNDILNANDFQRNLAGHPRPPWKSVRTGLFAGGPLRRKNLFASTAVELFRFRSSSENVSVIMPGAAFTPPAGSFAAQVLAGYHAPPGTGVTANVTLPLPSSLNQFTALPRIDWTPKHAGTERIFLRVPVTSITRPQFMFSPYPAYSSPLTQHIVSPGISWLAEAGPHITSEFRAGFSDNLLEFYRARSDVPAMASDDWVQLPGSPYFYSFRNRSQLWQALDDVVIALDRHSITVGAGYLGRRLSSYLSPEESGYYGFASLADFANGAPYFIRVSLSREPLANGIQAAPNNDRRYGIQSFDAFAQDSYRLSRHLVLNAGVRVDHASPPASIGSVPDAQVVLPAAASIDESVRTARLSYTTKPVYRTRALDWSGRFGLSWSPGSGSKTLLRGGYGIYYDQPFDNLWLNLQNNNDVLASGFYSGPAALPVANLIPSLPPLEPDLQVTRLYAIAPRLNSPRVYSYFAGAEHEINRSMTVELNFFGSNSSSLIATDVLNRKYAVRLSAVSNPFGRFNPNLPSIIYRTNLGFSDYKALALSAVWRSRRVLVRSSFTWSHSIDNQSDPLVGDFYDLNLSAAQTSAPTMNVAAFSTELNRNIDKGNSDFDQRYNFALVSVWNLPGFGWLFRNWMLSNVMAIRSGFPYTVTSSSAIGNITDGPLIYNRRPDLIAPSAISAQGAVKGGIQLLNRAAFQPPPVLRQGNLGRNSFTAPGFYSLDLSLARTMTWELRGRTFKTMLRADAFNLLNHANLGPPVSDISSPQFGRAQYGLAEPRNSFPGLTPLTETPRQIQLMLRAEF